jgi:hypothetical protein
MITLDINNMMDLQANDSLNITINLIEKEPLHYVQVFSALPCDRW